MKYPWIDEYLMAKRGVTKDLQAEWNWIRYHIGGKMFAAVLLDHDDRPYYINLKLDPAEGELMRKQYPDVIPGYYSNKLHWNSVKPDGDIPDDLLEAAAIDGSSPVRTFFTIVMPISKTVYATVFILDFVAHWNDFMWPFLVMTGEDKRTIQLAVQSFFSTSPVHYSAIMAALVISAIPMIIMFIFMQKYYVEGIASSGIKG